jgi:hypothetical protein
MPDHVTRDLIAHVVGRWSKNLFDANEITESHRQRTEIIIGVMASILVNTANILASKGTPFPLFKRLTLPQQIHVLAGVALRGLGANGATLEGVQAQSDMLAAAMELLNENRESGVATGSHRRAGRRGPKGG